MADTAFVPYVPPDRTLPETTVKAVVLGVVLSVLLGAANTYLGLRVGLTVSASIPAAVVSMAVLRLFRRRNILENNAVQTAASAGEALAAGVLFTIPALLLLDYWQDIHYLETTLIALTGGMLGVLFTVPLRRALIVEADLKFPEGIATSEVLKAGERGARAGLAALALGAAAGAVYKFLEAANRLWTGSALYGARVRDGVIAVGADLSPALLAVGYIVGLHIATLVFLGGVLGWIVAIPLYSAFAGDAAQYTAGADPVTAAAAIWSARVRYIGVGAMLVGGIWSLVKLRGPLRSALRAGGSPADDGPRGAGDGLVLRTDRSLSMRLTYAGVLVLSVPLTALYWFATGNGAVALVLAAVMLVTGFLFSALGAYMAGIVGSSNNPISGVTILTVLASALLLRAMGVDVEAGPAAAILVAAVIASAAAIGSDNLQDLKAGYLLGATPKRQQVMQMVGVAAGAVTVALVLQVLTTAYELGSPDLAAPQAGLMAAVAGGVFGLGEIPTAMVGAGMLLAVALIVLDETLARRGSTFRTPVMPVAVGVYLPVGLSAPIFIGGLVAWGTSRWLEGRPRVGPATVAAGKRNGVLMSSGLIAGEALVGILVAGLVVLQTEYGLGLFSTLALSDASLRWTGVLLLAYIAVLLAYFAVRPALVERRQ